ncbi:MAG: family 16 glycosylhydrolase [Pyrinomonadaceae bacterium]
MNGATYSGLLFRWVYRLMLSARWVGTKPICKSFGGKVDQRVGVVQHIYVINLDRQVDRWNHIQRELHRIYGSSRAPLTEIANRFSAVDARYFRGSPNHVDLQTSYSLSDQLFVEPNPLLRIDQGTSNHSIAMTRQEIAVALSHIAVWKLIASSDHLYTLVLEDDVYFPRDFAQILDTAWAELTRSYGTSDAFDVLYLSYKEAKTKAEKHKVSDFLFRPRRGLWWLSGYVLSKKGAKNLLALLPVRGPVDLWLNHQFDKLDVLATHRSIIYQRRDCRSDNSYSILPVLSRVGVSTKEEPLLFKKGTLPKPAFAFGRERTGLTSLAMALSMLGYRCCSDIDELPKCEHDDLMGKKKSRVFDAYVNVGSLCGLPYIELAKLYRGAKFIITVGDEEELIELDQERASEGVSRSGHPSDEDYTFHTIYRLLHRLSAHVLVLPMQKRDKWEMLCEFLECEHPTSQYPHFEEQAKRHLSLKGTDNMRSVFPALGKLKFDSSPWIAVSRRQWHGVPLAEVNVDPLWENDTTTVSENFQAFDNSSWMLLDDTFPSNLALFNPSNFSITNDNIARLTLRKERTRVREYTSASICSRRSYLYGRFSTVIRPANVPGLVTGVFLHRNSPRQEIDIEFLGKGTTKLLVNVYYNPGSDGANLEYGYRGTPMLIDLGFDASKAFHRYSIEWSSTSIRWLVDGYLAHERVNWDPTPIPHLPLQFYVNLWHSRSEELAGRLFDRNLPAHSEMRSIDIDARSLPVTASGRLVRSGKTAIRPEFKDD